MTDVFPANGFASLPIGLWFRRAMMFMPTQSPILRAAFLVLVSVSMVVGQQQRTPIPDDLLFDEHVREEFGVNDFTAPSIERIFKDLERLGDLPYGKLSRKLADNVPKQRSVAALSLGALIADGLLTVQSEKRGDLKPIGEALKAHAESLGADKRVNRHTKSLVEHSLAGDWPKLKRELAATQNDVEAELVLLRDVHVAHLISLGGWLRAFQIACGALKHDFDAERAKSVIRVDVIDYFNAEMEYIEVDDLSKNKIEALHEDLIALRELMEPKEDGSYTQGQIEELARSLNALLTKLFMRQEAARL